MNEDTDNGGPVGNQNPYPMFAYKFENIVLGGKKMFKRIKVFLAVALVVMMCLAGSLTALADEEKKPGFGSDNILYGTELNPAEAAIAKKLQMPIGTNVPTAVFNFTATPVSLDNVNYDSVAGTPVMPELKNLSVTYPGAPSGTAGAPTITTVGDVTTVSLETANILKDVDFPHAGIYVYTITEQEKTNTGIDNNVNHEVLKYSKGVYTLTIYIENKAAGDGTFVASIVDQITTADIPGGSTGGKVDPTPGSSKMVFTNTYFKTNGPTDPNEPEDPTANSSTLLVNKTVPSVGLGDKTKYFSYTMTVQAPSLVYDPSDSTATAPTYHAYIIEPGDAVDEAVLKASLIDASKNHVTAATGTDGEGNEYIKFVSGTATTFSLKDGQRLVFFNTPVGTRYGVTETGNANYVADVKVTYKGGTPYTTVNAAVEALIGKPLGTDSAIPANNPYSSDSLAENPNDKAPLSLINLVGEGNNANSAEFTNTYFFISPTGLIINVLPFVGLIILAGGALVAFIVVRSRKRIADSE